MRLRQKKKLSFKGHCFYYGSSFDSSVTGKALTKKEADRDIKNYYKICTTMGMSQRLFIKQGLDVYNNWKKHHNFNRK